MKNKIIGNINSLINVIEKKKTVKYSVYAAALLIMFLIPKIGLPMFMVRILTMIGMYVILSLSLNLITGYTGQVSIGHAGFCAIGAYTSALISLNFGLNFFITALLGALVAGIFGLLLGLPTLRLSGTYLTIATLGFGEVIRMVILNWESLTNGPLGITKIQRPVFFGIELTSLNGGLFYLVWVLVFITTVIIYRIIRSKMGRALMAIREDELVATLMGIKTTNLKVYAFIISAFFAGLGGSFYAHMIRYIDPNTFTFDTSIMIISIVIFGGMGTIRGMFLGSALLISFPEALRFLQEYRFVVFGLILVLMIRYRPQGILGGQSKRDYKMPEGVNLDSIMKEG
ncbi:branched-chain amino acid ABC transporter permease [Abyssisolibacter fermentans]|uniref:branched-chain amino acid ABC transporter permease n=1 Tax=Abyssisolibacter fermentans TaxID=1766203 RepID=UPI00082BA694|nr:branched-chain amino acid ABC transporter permease [Abyssisolibacter fermentans]